MVISDRMTNNTTMIMQTFCTEITLQHIYTVSNKYCL